MAYTINYFLNNYLSKNMIGSKLFKECLDSLNFEYRLHLTMSEPYNEKHLSQIISYDDYYLDDQLVICHTKDPAKLLNNTFAIDNYDYVIWIIHDEINVDQIQKSLKLKCFW